MASAPLVREYDMRRNLPTPVNIVLGAGLLGILAALGGYAAYEHPRRELLPIFFIFIALVVALRLGSSAGVAGTLVAATVFAYTFSPQGSLRIADVGLRQQLGWLIIGGVSLSFLFGSVPGAARPQVSREPENRQHRKHAA